MRTAKMTVFLFMAMLGFALGMGRTMSNEWEAVPNFFFSAMFFAYFVNTVLDKQKETT